MKSRSRCAAPHTAGEGGRGRGGGAATCCSDVGAIWQIALAMRNVIAAEDIHPQAGQYPKTAEVHKCHVIKQQLIDRQLGLGL